MAATAIDIQPCASPNDKVISHPEAGFEVCQIPDYVGSTEYIIETITDSEPGSQWLGDTEPNLANRLQHAPASENARVAPRRMLDT